LQIGCGSGITAGSIITFNRSSSGVVTYHHDRLATGEQTGGQVTVATAILAATRFAGAGIPMLLQIVDSIATTG